MENKNITKDYRRAVLQKALSDVRHQLGVRGELVRLLIQIVFGVLALALAAMLVYFGILRTNQDAYAIVFNIIAGFLIGAIFLFAGISIAVPVLARWNMWRVAAEESAKQDRDLRKKDESLASREKEFSDLQAYYKERERLARGELITIRESRDANSVAVEIINGEIGNPFNGTMYITELTNHAVPNQIEVSPRGLHVLPNGGRATIKLAVLDKGAVSIMPYGTTTYSEAGEYQITTVTEGRFFHNSYEGVYLENRWRLIFDPQKNVFELKPHQ